MTDAEVDAVRRAQAELIRRLRADEPDMPEPDFARSGALWEYLTVTLGLSPERAEEVMRKG